jgi:hypothetical protein
MLNFVKVEITENQKSELEVLFNLMDWADEKSREYNIAVVDGGNVSDLAIEKGKEIGHGWVLS